MEIPYKLKKLYRHWEHHTYKSQPANQIQLDETTLNKIYPVITERMKVWEKRQAGAQPPYTEHGLLSKYRFCNIYRELDRQTIEIHTQLKPLEHRFDLWLLNIIFHRMVCKPETILKTGLLSFDSKNNQKVKKCLLAAERPKYGVAYVFPISVVKQVGCANREEFFCEYLPSVADKCAETIKTFNKISVTEALQKVLHVFGANFKFHWTEVLIDVAYQYPQYIDLFKEFPIGPGSIPTMLKLNSKEKPEKVCKSLVGVEIPNFPYLTYEGKPVWLSAENWEGIGCEFRKYSNLEQGVGRKRLYRY